jgi:DNA-binding XRE family transcriptional regulator
MKEGMDTMAKKAAEQGYAPARRRANLSPGQALKTVRELQGTTQVELAKATGIEQATVSALEHDRANIRVERAETLAVAQRLTRNAGQTF